MNIQALYPGTFDPITYGHLDLIEKAASLFARVLVAVALNPAKNTLFSFEKRFELATHAVNHLPNVQVIKLEGLLTQCVQQHHARVIVRGIRGVRDFDYEFQLAGMNQALDPNIETIFLKPSLQVTHISSTLVKEIAQLNGDVQTFVPANVHQALSQQFRP